MTVAIVCGGRDYANVERVYQILDAAVTRLGLTRVIEGECPTAVNADKLARSWAELRGVPCEAVPAETRNGKFLGPARNQLMLTMLLRYPEDKVVIAFKGGRGTGHMKRIASAAGVRVIDVVDKETSRRLRSN